jgi:hypothetical protein
MANSGWSDTPPQSQGWSDTPPPAPALNDKDHDPLAGYAAGTPVRDDTLVDYTDPQTGQKVTVPAWSLPNASRPPVAPDNHGDGYFDFMADTANLRPDPTKPDPFDLTDYQKALIGGPKGTPMRLLTDYGFSPLVQGVNRLQAGLLDTINMGSRAITGQNPNDGGNQQSVAENLMDYLPGLGLEAIHIPEGYVAREGYFTPAVKADLTNMLKSGASADEILAKYPKLNPQEVRLNVKFHSDKRNKSVPVSFGEEPIPDELSGKRPEVQPPVTPTADTTHVDPIRETDETGTYHPVNVRNPDTGEVTSAGRAYVDPDTGAPQGSVLSHPLTKENHVVTPATQGVIESKLPGGNSAAHLIPSDISLPPPIRGTFVSKEISPEGGDPRFGQTHPDGQPLSAYDPDLIDDRGNSVNPEGTLPPGSTHEFTYTTSDGKVVKGGYRLNDQGEMHGLSIGEIGNPTNLGTPETINLIRSIANEHPDVHTIYAKRMSGANPNRDMVLDAQKLRDRTVPDGTTSLETKPVETEPSVAEESQVPPAVSGNGGTGGGPEGPEKPAPSVNTDQYAGNINKDRLLDENGQPVNAGVRSELDEAADRVAQRQGLGNDETRGRAWSLIDQHGEDALLSPTAFQKFSHPDDLVAWPVAVRNIINRRAIQFSRAKQAAGDANLTQEQATALSDHENALTDAVDKGMDVIQVGPRMTQSGHIIATPEELSPEEWQAVKDNAKKAVVDSGGNPAVIDQVMKDTQSEKGRSLLGQAWYGGLLSNWQTHFHYAQGLGLQNLVDLVQHGIGSVLDQPGRLVTANDFPRIYGREVLARAWGSASGAINAIVDVGRKVDSAASRLKELGKDTSTETNLVSGISSIPTSVIGTIGDIAKQAGTQGELYARSMRNAIKDSPESSNRSALNTITGALKDNSSGFGNAPETDVMTRYRENLENPSEDDLEAADRHGKMLSFEDDPSPITSGMKKLQFALDKAAQDPSNPLWTRGPAMAMSGASRMLLPFIGREDAVIRSGIRNGLLGQVPGLDRYNTNLMKEAQRGDARSRALLAGKAILAGGATAALVMKAMNGQLTGSIPSDQAERDQFVQEEKIPQAYKGDDGKWHSVVGITPLASNLTMIADAVDKYKKDEDYHDYWRTMTDVSGSVLHSLADPSWLGTLGPLFDNSNHSNRVASTIAGLAGTVVPAGVRAANQTYFDPVSRDTSGSNLLERSLNQVKSSIPGLSQTLPARTDTLGRPVIKEKGLTETSTPDRDPVTNEIERLGKNGAAVVKAAGKSWTGYTTDEDGDDIPKKVPFTSNQYREYVQKSGDYIRKDFASVMADPEYQNMSEYKKLKTLREVIKDQRANARDEILDRDNGPVNGGWSDAPPQSQGWNDSPPKQKVNK